MKKTPLLALLAAVATLGACYGSAPPRPPRVPLPPTDAETAIAVRTVTKTNIENVDHTASTCPTDHAEGDPACTITHYTVAEPVTRTTTTASYGETPINFAQFAVLTDPKFDAKLAELAELSHKCTRANVPRYAGIGLMLGGLLVGSIVGGDAGKGIAYGGLAGGAGSYGVGFFAYGGRDCVRAQQLHDSIDYSRQMSWSSVEGQDYAVRMKELAEKFNAEHGARASASNPSTTRSMRMR